MSSARAHRAIHGVTSILLGLSFAALTCSCGGTSGGGGSGGGQDPDFALPGLRILAVQAAGPGRDLTVTVEVTAPAAGIPVGGFALAQTLRLSSISGDVLNDIVTTSSGTPDRNGITGLTAPTSGSIQITFTISGSRATTLPVEAGIELEVRITDGFTVAQDFLDFDIDPFGPINEPTCEIASPTGGTIGGQIPISVAFSDLEGDPASATFTYTVAGGARIPCTLVAGSSPFLGGYTPTDPANGFTQVSSQATGIGTPASVLVLWDSAADGVGLGARVPVELTVFTEDGTTMGAGPFFSCAVEFYVDNRPVPQAMMGIQVVPLGDAVLLDPRGVLGGPNAFLGTNARLRVGGSGFGLGSQIQITPGDGIVTDGTDRLGSVLLETSLRTAPDGPSTALSETGQLALINSRFVTVNTVLHGALNVTTHGQLLSLSCDRFTVDLGGTFNVGVQVPSALLGGSDPLVAFAAALRFDPGALRVNAVRGGTHPEFSFVPQTLPNPATGAIDRVVVFADPVPRSQQIEAVMNVANVEFALQPGVIAGTRIHIWLDPTDGDNVLLSAGGFLVFGTGDLAILGTSILTQ